MRAIELTSHAAPGVDGNLADLAGEAASCRRCPLFLNGSRTVFGAGPQDARIMLVGEQPGDSEDRTGQPFVGPAGKLLDRALKEAGLERGSVYVTNAVKHFKHEDRGKRRLHKHPNRYEISQCRWWLDKELAFVGPKLVVALGAISASALMGRAVTLKHERGKLLKWQFGLAGLATIHPASVLRMGDDELRSTAFSSLVDDLRVAVAFTDLASAPD